MKNPPYISVITPVYGCAENLRELYHRLVKTLSAITENFEIIMVYDRSPDDAWQIIRKLASGDPRVKGIKLSKNFGQHKAITAGLDYAEGEWVVVMDCDLQDLPEEIPKLYRTAMEGYDVVFGRRVRRKDNILKRISSKINYFIFNRLSGIPFDESIANFSIISGKVVQAHRKIREQNRSYSIFTYWMGFRRKDIEIEHAPRKHGRSTYSFKKLVKLALDGIVAHSNKPLQISTYFGFALSLFSLLYAMWLVLQYFLFEITVPGWTSVMVSLYFIGGLLFANIGIIGVYVGKIFHETKNRPLYLIQETTFRPDEQLSVFPSPAVSVVVPVRNCASEIESLCRETVKTLRKLTENFELILVDDASKDSTWDAISEMARIEPRIKGIELSREFGLCWALTAGLDFAEGERVVVMDCNGIDNPAEIPELYRKAEEGYDVVFGTYRHPGDGKEKFFRKYFSKILESASGIEIEPEMTNFSIVSKRVLENYRKLREHYRSYIPFIRWLGFETVQIPLKGREEKNLQNRKTFKKLLFHQLHSVITLSNKPLRLSMEFGFIMTAASLIYGSWLILKYFLYGIPVPGWTSVMVSIYFIGGMLFANLGVLGLYIGKIFNETKKRPIYIVEETTFGNGEK
ncbi:glycosyltransferase family 2 protein [Hydrogenimonas sp. SS33]|uniref:glycosyltransferase family 2 protein n=1 Tax=Hydrogenimonas leucolamina TaxID=2954236 RepID=UPI00336C0436